MKHYLSTAALLAGTMLAVTSCSNEDALYGGEEGMTVFSVKLPDDLGTRAPFGDAPSNQELNVAIYEAGNTEKALFTSINGVTSEGMTVEQFAADGLTATVKVPLVKNKQYDLVFWSQDKTNRYYTYTENGQTLTVGYGEGEGATVENYLDSRDAFFASKTVTSGDAANSQTIQLKRMFAQINVGTNDLKAYTAAGGSDSFGITVSGVATEINLKSGIVSNPAGTVTATTANAASSETDFPAITGYTGNKLQYLSMIYVLVGDGAAANKTNVDVSLYANGTEGFATYANVPVQMNYRTNIYGALLTNPEVFNVTIDPIFAGEYNKEITFAATAEEFTSAIENAQDGDVIRPTANMSLAAVGSLNIDNNVTIDVPEGVTVTTARQGNVANIVVVADKTVSLTGQGTFSGDNRIVDTNGNLIVDGPTFVTSTPDRGCPISVNAGGTLEFMSGTVDAAQVGIWVTGTANIYGGTFNSKNVAQGGTFQVDEGATLNIDGGTITAAHMGVYSFGNVNIKGGVFNLTSTNLNGPWAYGIQSRSGSRIVINDGEFYGKQGIVSASQHGYVEINGGFFRTQNTEGHKDGFYCVYSTDGADVNINGGYFYGANQWNAIANGLSCIVSGDNDVNQPLGSIKVKGGYFSGRPYYLEEPNPVLAPVTGSYVPCSVVKNGLTFTWTVGQ